MAIPALRVSEFPIWLAAAFAVVALVVTVFLIFRQYSHGSAIKLLGSLMVLAIAFAADNWGVYALSTFIVATLVTELHFLEKLAAIFWNRDKYWEYLMQKANAAEIREKQERDAVSDEAQLEGVDEPQDAQRESESVQSQKKARAIQFEQNVLTALQAGKGPFPAARVRKYVKVLSRFDTAIIDAVANHFGAHLVVEIKHLSRPSGLLNVRHQLDRVATTYRNYLRERGRDDPVIPVVIVPDALNVSTIFQDNLLILKYDEDKGEFTNAKQFLHALRGARLSAV